LGQISTCHKKLDLGLSTYLRAVESAPAPREREPKGDADQIGAIVFGSDQGLVGQFNDLISGFAVKTRPENSDYGLLHYANLQNFHRCSGGDEVKESNDFRVEHADTSVACGLANEVFLVCAVDVDVAVVGVGIFGVEA